MFLVIFAAVLGLDALFWWWADRSARLLPRAKAWRIGIALFVGLQIAYALALTGIPGFGTCRITTSPHGRWGSCTSGT